MAKFSSLVVAFVCLLSIQCALAEPSTEVCGTCHAQLATGLKPSPHAHAACTDCHGDATQHLRSPGVQGSILNLTEAPVTAVNAACGTCHKGSHKPGGNVHERVGVACTSCHSLHKEPVTAALPAEFGAVDRDSAMCLGCHQALLNQFAFNERHRLAEGALSCISCHDPHAPRAAGKLGSAKSTSCSECHADSAGPFVFEHAASRVEGCTACHDPHGSPNRHMLTHQQVGALCYSCHAVVPQFHLGFSPVGAPRFDERTVCTNCHVTIHGSNLDRLFLR